MTFRGKFQAWARQPGVLSSVARAGLASALLGPYYLCWFFVSVFAFFSFSSFSTLPVSFLTKELFILTIFVMGLLALPILHVVYLMTQRLEQRPTASVGLLLGWHSVREFFSGLVLGIILPSISFLYLYWNGDIQISPLITPLTLETLSVVLWILLLMLGWFGVAFWEELYFRGYLLQTWASGIGIVPAVLVTSMSFGAIHVVTYGMNFLILLNLAFMGIIFAALYLKTKSLWAPIGMHFASNFWSAHVLPIPIEKDMNFPFITVNGQTIHLEPLRLLWQTEFIEGKGLADLYSWAELPFNLAFCGLLILLIWKLPWFRPHPEMEALWQQYVPIAQPWAQLKTWWVRRQQAARDQAPPPGS